MNQVTNSVPRHNTYWSNSEDSSPRSDVTGTTASSYDDGPAESTSIREFPRTEQRLYVINRAGSGEASYLLLTEDQNDILSYRVHTEIWKPIYGIINFGVVVIDRSIYVIGGFHKMRAVCLNRVMRYDAREGDWTVCSNMILPRAKFGVCTTSDGRIHVCGGERTDGKTTANCEVYDPETDTWTKSGRLLAPRSNPVCAGFGRELLCAGGFFNGLAHDNLWLYERYEWQEMDEHYPHRLPYCLHKSAIASVGNTFYIIGGISPMVPREKRKKKDKENKDKADTNKDDSTDSQYQDKLKPSDAKAKGGRAADVTDKPRFQTERRMFSYSTRISLGPSKDADPDPQPDLISPWNLKLPPMLHTRHSAGAVRIGNKIHAVGGTCVETGQPIEVSEHFDLVKGLWEEDFTLRKCDVSNVGCVLLEVPKVPLTERKNTYKLRWVMW